MRETIVNATNNLQSCEFVNKIMKSEDKIIMSGIDNEISESKEIRTNDVLHSVFIEVNFVQPEMIGKSSLNMQITSNKNGVFKCQGSWMQGRQRDQIKWLD